MGKRTVLTHQPFPKWSEEIFRGGYTTENQGGDDGHMVWTAPCGCQQIAKLVGGRRSCDERIWLCEDHAIDEDDGDN